MRSGLRNRAALISLRDRPVKTWRGGGGGRKKRKKKNPNPIKNKGGFIRGVGRLGCPRGLGGEVTPPPPRGWFWGSVMGWGICVVVLCPPPPPLRPPRPPRVIFFRGGRGRGAAPLASLRCKGGVYGFIYIKGVVLPPRLHTGGVAPPAAYIRGGAGLPPPQCASEVRGFETPGER